MASGFTLPLTQFHAGFVCNFLSSSASFILCSCLAWLAFDLPLRFLCFCLSLGFRFHDRLPFPLLFLTPAVFAFFRPLQFWVLTTQPLFFFSASFTVPPPSGFPAAPSLLSSLRSFLSLSGSFLIPSGRFCLLSFAVRFLSLFPVSLPQPFHRCLSSLRFVSSASFRPSSFFAFCFLSSAFGFPDPATQLFRSSVPLLPSLALRQLAWCPPLLSSLRFPRLPPSGFPSVLFRFRLLGSLPRFLSSFPTSLPQPFRWCLPFLPLRFLCFFFRHSSFASVSFRSLPL